MQTTRGASLLGYEQWGKRVGGAGSDSHRWWAKTPPLPEVGREGRGEQPGSFSRTQPKSNAIDVTLKQQGAYTKSHSLA